MIKNTIMNDVENIHKIFIRHVDNNKLDYKIVDYILYILNKYRKLNDLCDFFEYLYSQYKPFDLLTDDYIIGIEIYKNNNCISTYAGNSGYSILIYFDNDEIPFKLNIYICKCLNLNKYELFDSDDEEAQFHHIPLKIRKFKIVIDGIYYFSEDCDDGLTTWYEYNSCATYKNNKLSKYQPSCVRNGKVYHYDNRIFSSFNI